MKTNQDRRRYILFLALAAAAVTAGFLAGITASRWGKIPATRSTKDPRRTQERAFDAGDRIRYYRALEQIRYRLRAGPDAVPFEQAVKTGDIERELRLQDKKMRILESWCGITIDEDMIDRELERMKNDYKRPGIMLEIANALDRDPKAIVEFWVKPILIDRYLDACVLADPEINAGAREAAMTLLEKTEAGRDSTPGSRATIRLDDPELETADRTGLENLEPGGLGDVVEGTFDFHFHRLISRSGDTVEVEVFSAPKPDPARWIEAQP